MKKILLSLLFIIGIGAVNAQTTDQQAEIDALNERIAKLEKRSQVWDKLKPVFKLSGYIQAGYYYLWNEDDGTKTSTFHLRRARMTM
ncbi:MAG: hypothetical protein IJO90_02685, partial [Alistipes sp.]|nr:hypothetical protein [Alistipes sp.]